MAATKPATAPQLFTCAEVAARLGCSRQHVYDLIAHGAFTEVVDISGGRRAKTRIAEPVLAAYIAARTRKTGGAHQRSA